MEGFVKGDVVVLEFPFSNLIRVKRRPSLVIKVPRGDDVIAFQITGKSYEKSVEIPIKKEDFNKGNLKVESYLRLDKIFSIEKSLIKYKIGSLKQEKFDDILDNLCYFLKNWLRGIICLVYILKFILERYKNRIVFVGRWQGEDIIFFSIISN